MENNHKQFNAYDKVLVRDWNDKWHIDLYSHWDEESQAHHTFRYNDALISVNNILPYEGNEHLVGTDQEPEEEVKLEEGEVVIVFDEIEHFLSNRVAIRRLIVAGKHYLTTNGSNWGYAVKFSDFNPEDMEETKKHILCVKNGKIVKYKD